DRDRHRFATDLENRSGFHQAVTVVRNNHGVGILHCTLQFSRDFFTSSGFNERSAGIDPDDLLPLRMDGSRKNAQLRWRAVGLRDEDAADINIKLCEELQKLMSFRIVSNNADRNRMCAERTQIVNRIGSTTR